MKKKIEYIIFNAKYLLLFFYFGMLIVLILYLFLFCKEVYELVLSVPELTSETALTKFINLLDMMMIANLIDQLRRGSYNSFISKHHGYDGENISSGMLKVKMGLSLIGISSVSLLQLFISDKPITTDDLTKRIIIHIAFILGALVMAIIEFKHVAAQKDEVSLEITKEEHHIKD